MKLEFKNPIFHEGINLTVRRGNRWLNKKASNFLIFYTKAMRFRDIKNKPYIDLLDLEHDPKCRTYKGLLRVMKKVYKKFSANQIVTLVFFFIKYKE